MVGLTDDTGALFRPCLSSYLWVEGGHGDGGCS